MGIRIFFTFICCTLAMIYVTACSAPEQVTKKERYFWPPLPDTPKIEWLGLYNSHKQLNDNKSLFVFFTGEEEAHGLNTPFAIAANGQGKVYVSDIGNLNVLVFDFITKSTHLFGGQQFTSIVAKPSGIDLDEDDNIYIGDMEKKKIVVFSKDETPMRVIDLTATAKNIGNFKIDRQRKHIIIPDIQGHKIIITDYKGTIIKTITTFKLANKEDGFRFPTTVAIDPTGNILVADSVNARLVRFSSEGEFLSTIGIRGDTIGTIDFVKGVATDSDGNIYTVDHRADRLQIFNDKGQTLLAIGDKGLSNAIGTFHAPNSIYIDKNDTIYITEPPAKRFQMLQYISKEYLHKNPISDIKDAAKPLPESQTTGKKP